MYDSAGLTSHRPWALIFLTLALSLLFSATSLAASPSFAGTYFLDEALSDDVSAVLEPAFAELNVVKRVAGRRLLQSRVLPGLRQIDVDQDETTLTIFDGRRPPLEIPSTGEEIDHRTERGKWVKLKGEAVDDVFRARIISDHGVYQLHSRLCPRQEQLEVHVNLEHRDLSEPVRFKLVYRRKS